MTDLTTKTFEDAWQLAEGIKGWMTRGQAEMLWNAASALGPGQSILEIGSHCGRSTVILGTAAQNVGATVTAVDPFVEGRLFGGPSTRSIFEGNIERAGLNDVVTLRAEYSTQLRPKWDEQIDLLYIDGKHDYWTVTDDLRWAEHVPTGGNVLIHDCFSSIGVTSAILAHVAPGHSLRYLDRSTSLARFEVGTPDAADRRRILAQLPWWARNVGIKVLLRARLNGVAEKFGHTGTADPY